jgi:hypothetical protein
MRHRPTIRMALLYLRPLPLSRMRTQPHAAPPYLPKSGKGSMVGGQAAGRPTNEDYVLAVRRLWSPSENCALVYASTSLPCRLLLWT